MIHHDAQDTTLNAVKNLHKKNAHIGLKLILAQTDIDNQFEICLLFVWVF